VKRDALCLIFGLFLALFPLAQAIDTVALALDGIEKLDAKSLSQKPIEITAKELVAERKERRVIFKGDVIAVQNNLFIYSDSLVAEYDEEGRAVAKIEAEGNVKVVQEGVREARGDKAVFINADQTVELSGNTVVSEGDSRLLGEKLIIYIAENRSVILGGENGRVKAIINPEEFMKEKKDKERSIKE
jgi:lipopolysaccharide export system protein LptA